jgi:hypothetical protein
MVHAEEFRQPEETALRFPAEYLSPEQRFDAIAEILATIALRVLKQSHENKASHN